MLKFDKVSSVTDFRHDFEDDFDIEKHSFEQGKKITRDTIKATIEWLKKGAKPGDTLMFYFSGHGSKRDVTDEWHADTYFNGFDADRRMSPGERMGHILTTRKLRRQQTIDSKDEKRYMTGLFTLEGIYYELKEDLTRGVPAGVTIVVILDACHSGTTMNLEYKLDNITSPSGCKWVKRQNADLDGQSQGPLVLTFASCQKAEACKGLNLTLDKNACFGGGYFTNAIKYLLQIDVDTNQVSSHSIRNVFDTVQRQVTRQNPKQHMMITSNNHEIDLAKISLTDLVNGSIGGANGTIQSKYRIRSGVPNIVTVYKCPPCKLYEDKLKCCRACGGMTQKDLRRVEK